MPIKLFNTLSRQKEIFYPLRDKKVGFYACGPTVYWFAHLGNFRTYIFEDVLRRVLEYNGYKVKHVMNYTDVGHLTSDADTGEDKMEKGAKREGKNAWEIADFYIKAFEKDARSLNILEPTITARATDHIKEQIALIKLLEKKEFTYIIPDGVYFDTSKLKDYGKLARLDLENLKAGARVEMSEGKKNPSDFALWKFSPPDSKRQMEWKSPWAPPGGKEKPKGFPGWHIECSAMSQKYLGKQFDIHASAIDHISVHHTNEIAQSEAAYDKIPARYWLHGEFILIDGNKMAKSTGEFLTIQKISEKFNPLAFRYLCLTAHYRSQLNLTWESLGAAQSALENLYGKFRNFENGWWLENIGANLGLAGNGKKETLKKYKQFEESFLEAINDDLDMPRALSLLWELADDPALPSAAKRELFLKFDKIFGLRFSEVKKIEIPKEIKKLMDEREVARQAKNWEKADEIRRKIEKAGWSVEDTAQGPKIKEQ